MERMFVSIDLEGSATAVTFVWLIMLHWGEQMGVAAYGAYGWCWIEYFVL